MITPVLRIPLRPITALCLIWLGLVHAVEPEPVVLQLNYHHQFQFAGYYAADIQGFYAEEGLAVDIRELIPGQRATNWPTEATFVVEATTVFERWGRGEDVFLIAVVQQRNPFVVLVREESPLRRLEDLLERPRERLIGPVAGMREAQLWSRLTTLGRDPDTFFSRPRAPEDLERFARGEIDVLCAYLTNEPATLRRMGVAVRPLEIAARHNLFFGDGLICAGELWRTRPALVEAFRRASLRGWRYALAHPDELVDHILARRPSRGHTLTRDHLRDEAAAVATLIDADLHPLGEVRIERVREVAAVMAAAGMPLRLDERLIYRQRHSLEIFIWPALAVLGSVAVALVVLARTTRRQHRHLLESQAHYRHLVELAEGYFAFRIRVDGNGMVPELASPSIAAVLGHPLSWYQAHPDRFADQLPRRERIVLAAAVQRTLVQGQPLRVKLTLRHGAHGGLRSVMVHALPSSTARGIIADGICIDLTAEASAEAERRRLLRQLEQAQRHESLGLLAGGVAHDFNNLLGAIRGNAELLRPALAEQPIMLDRWERLLMAIDRATGLVRQILAYTGKATIEPRPLALEREVRQLVALLKHALPADITVDVAIEAPLPAVLFDPVQFQQVVLNLVVNAAESYQGRPGVVTVSAVRSDKDRIVLRVSDLGCGMDAVTMARMFEPYFTTKQRGHGLGLAAVQGIIRKAGGTLECHSALGKGTTFTVTLAAVEAAAITESGRYRTPPPMAGSVRCILVVDDDDLLREMAAAMLRDLGYRTREASGGRQCLAILEAEGAGIDAVLLDCRMPDLDGVSVLRRLRAERNRMPVVLTSGYANGEDLRLELSDPFTCFLAKPFALQQLARAVTGLLGETATGDQSSTFSPVGEWVRQRRWQGP